jgi:hypothetical protein
MADDFGCRRDGGRSMLFYVVPLAHADAVENGGIMQVATVFLNKHPRIFGVLHTYSSSSRRTRLSIPGISTRGNFQYRYCTIERRVVEQYIH